MATCCIAFGGNIGDTPEVFRDAMTRLEDSSIGVRSVSSLHRTPAMGADAGDEFVNATALIETDLQPVPLLDRLHEIESELGRRRSVHWGPRQIDLDLLFYEQQVIDTDEIVVPHPSLWYRRFVLEPLAEIAPEFMHPILRQNVGELFQQQLQRPLTIAIIGEGLTDLSLSDTDVRLRQRFGAHSVQLVRWPDSKPLDESVFAAIRLDHSEPRASRSQPPQEPDRSLRVFVSPDHIQDRIFAVLTDVCCAALRE